MGLKSSKPSVLKAVQQHKKNSRIFTKSNRCIVHVARMLTVLQFQKIENQHGHYIIVPVHYYISKDYFDIEKKLKKQTVIL